MSDSGDTSNPIEITFGEPGRQRRWTVLIRGVLYLPQVVVLFFVGIAVFCVVVYSWFAALLLGRVPRRAADFVLRYLRWQTRVAAYAYLLTDRYPPFSGRDDPEHPVRLAGNPGRLNRAAVLFRLVLVFPAAVWSSLLGGGLVVFSVITWIVTLVLGRTPAPIFEANAVALRYNTRVNAYTYLVTSEWPWGSFGDQALAGQDPTQAVGGPPPEEGSEGPTVPGGPVKVLGPDDQPVGWALQPGGFPSYPVPDETTGQETRPTWWLVASRRAKVLLVVFLLLGLVAQVAYYGVVLRSQVDNTVVLARTSDAIDTLNRSLATTDTHARHCPTGNRRLSCISPLLRRQSRSYARLGDSLRAIRYPSSVAAQASAMEQAMTRTAAIYLELSKAATADQLVGEEQRERAGIDRLRQRFNSQYQSLLRSL